MDLAFFRGVRRGGSRDHRNEARANAIAGPKAEHMRAPPLPPVPVAFGSLGPKVSARAPMACVP